MNKIILVLILILLSITSQTTQACTIFTIRSETKVFFGNNEDYIYDNTFISFKPGNDTTYGIAILGFHNNNFFGDNYPQGGYNTEGLIFDANALPPLALNNHSNDRLANPTGYVLETILRYCKDVPEVIDWFQTHDFNMTEVAGQFHFADAKGNATVISVFDGEWAFTGIDSANYLVSTNYNLANSSNGEYPSWRYNNAVLLLQQIDTRNITEESLVNVLKSTHLEGETHTVYSYIVNLQSLNIILFFEHNYLQKKTFNLETELVGGEHMYDLGELFKQQNKNNNMEGFEFTVLIMLLISIPIVKKCKNNNVKRNK